jgi:hypothetical protein
MTSLDFINYFALNSENYGMDLWPKSDMQSKANETMALVPNLALWELTQSHSSFLDA